MVLHHECYSSEKEANKLHSGRLIKEAQHSSVWLHQLTLHGFEQISIIMSLAPVMQNELHYSLKLLVKRPLF